MSATTTTGSGSGVTSHSTASSTPTGVGGAGNGPSSPLLFFVALGFGVVFTNLWIIVGVKYCFRYNQRNRQRMNGEDPDGVDLGAMPRQHRRRREKKLMTMEEVNEKFPLTKYKTWRSTRAEEGLSTAGGITTNAISRPASIRESREPNENASTDLVQTTTFDTADEKAETAEHGKVELRDAQAESATASDSRPKTAQSKTVPPESPVTKVETNDEDAEEDDHIQTAVPAEQLPDPGDACAICIDTIEDDDDVRGLHCGHAFHASCVDPWLTSRRACCPLCKADYYVPKPRPEGADAEDTRRRGTRGENIAAPQFAFMGGGRGFVSGGRRPTMVLPGRFMTIVYDERDRYGFPRVVREPRPSRAEIRVARRQASVATTANGDTETPATQRSWLQRISDARIPSFSRGTGMRGNHLPESTTSAATESVTPAQLEAGRT